MADSVKDYSRSVLRTLERVRLADLERLYREFERQGLRDMKEDGFGPKAVVFEKSLDLRYLGQSYEINLPYRGRPIETLRSEFDRRHRTMYSYIHPDAPVEIVNARLKVRGLTPKFKLRKIAAPRSVEPGRAVRKRQTLHYERRAFRAEVYDRAGFFPGTRLRGPALIVDFGSTTFLPPGFILRVDAYLNLILRKDGRR